MKGTPSICISTMNCEYLQLLSEHNGLSEDKQKTINFLSVLYVAVPLSITAKSLIFHISFGL